MTSVLSPPGAANETDAGDRGRTTTADRVIERIAAKVITEVDGVGGAAQRVLGVAVGGEDLDRSVKVTAQVSGYNAALDVRLSIAYPAPVAATTQQARDHLMRRVLELTGLTVTRVDITVTALHSDAIQVRRVQ
jgi:uncharacterized alkaline shock family protein YloU